MRGEEFDKRRRKILELIVCSYISTATPVGSRAVARQFRPGVSPSTIRNEMGALTELGYIRKPHISAGRVPTDKGYRYYVDSLIQVRHPSPAQVNRIAKECFEPPVEVEEIMEKTCRILSSITHQAGMILFPQLKKSAFGRLELAPTSSRNVLVIGRNCILEQPEFKDLNKVRLVMTALEEKEGLLEILNEDSKVEGLKCHIGMENKFDNMWDLSLVTSTYRFGESIFGSLGVLGPKRMEYSKVMGAVDHMARVVSQVLNRW